MKYRRIIMAAMAALTAILPMGVLAATYNYVGTGTLWSGTTGSDITNANNWSSGEMPNSANDYLVSGSDSNHRLCTVALDGSFPGNSLTIKGLGQNAQLVLKGSPHTYSFPNGGLILEAGTVWLHSWADFTIGGPVTVGNYGSTWRGVYLYGYQSAKTLTFTGPFTSASDSILNVLHVNEDTSDPQKYTVYFKGDMSGYVGSIIVGGTTRNWARACFGATQVNGTVQVNPTGAIGPCAEGVGLGECSVKDLVLTAGSTLKLSVSAATNGIVRVTNSLTMPETGKVKLDMTTYRVSASDQYWPSVKRLLLVAPLGTGLEPDLFDVSLPSNFPTWVRLPRASLLVETTADEERLYWNVIPYHAMTTVDAWGQSAFLSDYAAHWSGHANGDSLDPEAIYYNNGYSLNTPRVSSGIIEFGGLGIIITKNSKITLQQSARIGHLYVETVAAGVRGVIIGDTAGDRILQGTLTTVDIDKNGGYAKFFGHSAKTVDIQSELRGSGNLSLTTTSNTSDAYGNASPTYILGGTNTAFSGKLQVANVTPPTYMTTLKVSDGRNLGGEMAEFTYDGVELRDGSRLEATASLELAEATRGLFVNGSGRIRVPNATDEMAVRSQLTIAGTLVKEGPGVLALGGSACRFTAEQSETPVAGTNVLEVSAGRIKALSKDAFQGLAIKFSADTGIEIPMPTEVDADTLQYGLCNTAWATPFDLTDCGGRLFVGVHDVTAVPDRANIAICTVSSSVASSLRGKIDIAKIPHHAETVSERDNGDGTVTFIADIRFNPETVIIVR